MQGIVQALITYPQLDLIPFRQRHIQAVIRPLLVLVGYGASALGKGGHIGSKPTISGRFPQGIL
jgi:hypothetical protein